MSDNVRERYLRTTRLSSIINHARLAAEEDAFLSAERIYKLLSFHLGTGHTERMEIYALISEALNRLISERYEYIEGEPAGRFMALVVLNEETASADSVWLDSVAGSMAGEYTEVVYSSSMPVRGYMRVYAAFLQTMNEEFYNTYAEKACHMDSIPAEQVNDFLQEEMSVFSGYAKALKLAALSGQRGRLAGIIDSVIDSIVYHPPYEMETLHRRIQMVVCDLVERLENEGYFAAGIDMVSEPLNLLLFNRNEAELRQRAHELGDRLCDYLDEKQSPERDAAEMVRSYIRENVGDINLCVSSVADHFDMNRRNINELFQRRFDCSIFDYIHRKRLEMASELLKSTGKTVAEVASLAGYGSLNTMIRAFKRSYGMGPAEYRRSGEQSL